MVLGRSVISDAAVIVSVVPDDAAEAVNGEPKFDHVPVPSLNSSCTEYEAGACPALWL